MGTNPLQHNIHFPPPDSKPPTAWQKIGKAVGHVFKTISQLPQFLFQLIVKVKKAVGNLLNLPSSTPPSLSPHVSIRPASADLKPVFQQKLKQKTPKPPQVEPDTQPLLEKEPTPAKIPDSKSTQIDKNASVPDLKKEELDDSDILLGLEDSLREHAQTALESDEEIEQEEILDSQEEEEIETPAPSSAAAIEPIQSASVASSGEIMDVPDDGNCLFYAVAIGLKKRVSAEIEEKLQWKVDLHQLTGDLSQAKELLKQPGATLRKQAADYLETHQSEEEVFLALFGGIINHNDVARQKIQEEEAVIPFLLEDIQQLETQLAQSPTSAVRKNLEEQLKAKREHVKTKQEAVEFENTHMPTEENIQGYIDMTREDHFYCDAAQIYALSKLYNIPIKFTTHHATPQQKDDMFNPAVASKISPVHIINVNEKHFKYKDV